MVQKSIFSCNYCIGWLPDKRVRTCDWGKTFWLVAGGSRHWNLGGTGLDWSGLRYLLIFPPTRLGTWCIMWEGPSPLLSSLLSGLEKWGWSPQIVLRPHFYHSQMLHFQSFIENVPVVIVQSLNSKLLNSPCDNSITSGKRNKNDERRQLDIKLRPQLWKDQIGSGWCWWSTEYNNLSTEPRIQIQMICLYNSFYGINKSNK